MTKPDPNKLIDIGVALAKIEKLVLLLDHEPVSKTIARQRCRDKKKYKKKKYCVGCSIGQLVQQIGFDVEDLFSSFSGADDIKVSGVKGRQTEDTLPEFAWDKEDLRVIGCGHPFVSRVDAFCDECRERIRLEKEGQQA